MTDSTLLDKNDVRDVRCSVRRAGPAARERLRIYETSGLVTVRRDR